MRSVGILELEQDTSRIVKSVHDSGEECSVTLRGEVVAILVPAREPRKKRSRAWLDAADVDDSVLVVPAIVLAEVAAAISRRTGRPRLARRAVRVMPALPMLRIVPIDTALAECAAELAAACGLRGADSIYVAVANELGLSLITWDRDQLERPARVASAATLASGRHRLDLGIQEIDAAAEIRSCSETTKEGMARPA